MKQGTGTSRPGDQKREPISHGVSVDTVSEIGLVYNEVKEPLHSGRGFNAPAPVATTHHANGSQGKHR